jgi:hypothetical protein
MPLNLLEMSAANLMDEGRFSGPDQPVFPSQIPLPAPEKMTPPPRTFGEIFCEQYHLPPESYIPGMLQRTLYPRARMVAPVIRLFAPGFFDADRDFVRGVGLIRRIEDLGDQVTEFHLHPGNRGFLRRVFKIRVSCQRMSRVVGEVLDPGESAPRGAAGAPTGP